MIRKSTKRRQPGRPGKEAPDGAKLLLRAAESVFAREGFQRATLRQIARKAGVDHALVVHHFGSKESLWEAVIEEQAASLAPFVAELTQLQKSVDIPIGKRMETAFRRTIAITIQNPECGMFLSSISSERGDKFDLLVERLLRPTYNAFLPLYVEAGAAGAVRNQNFALLQVVLLLTTMMTISHRHLLGYFEKDHDDISRLQEEMTQFLIVNFLVKGGNGGRERSQSKHNKPSRRKEQGRK